MVTADLLDGPGVGTVPVPLEVRAKLLGQGLRGDLRPLVPGLAEPHHLCLSSVLLGGAGGHMRRIAVLQGEVRVRVIDQFECQKNDARPSSNVRN